MPRLTRQDFERLLEFRVTLRRFQRWSEDQAQAEGLTHVQHQLLVAIKGHHGKLPPTMGDLAGYLLLRPHSTVELVDRAEAAGLVERTPDPVPAPASADKAWMSQPCRWNDVDVASTSLAPGLSACGQVPGSG
jgi:hypothetical protein